MNEYYKEALRLAQKDYRMCVVKGKSPCLPVMDDFVSQEKITTGINLGLSEIPLKLIVGTKSRGRVNAFAPNFMPILEETTEFATTLSKIVDMVELLNEVDTEGVPVTTTMADRKTVMREDVAVAGDDRDELFKNVPQSENYYIKVPAILEDGGDA